MARLERFELPTLWFVARYSIQLSYRRAETENAFVADRAESAKRRRLMP